MKLLEAINESEDSKLLKKLKTIFSALKEGTITRKDGVSFSYEISDNMDSIIKKGKIQIYGFVSKIIERTYCPINEMYMTEMIENRFKKFGIDANLRQPFKSDVYKFNGKKPWETDLNEQDDVVITDDYTYPTEEQKKKARIIYKAFKRGKFTIEDGGGTYKYVLPDEYYVSVSGDGVLNIVLTMNPQQKMKMYHMFKDYEGNIIEKNVDTTIRTHLYQWMKDSIENKFKQFQINFLF
jgi:hypothetical protein